MVNLGLKLSGGSYSQEAIEEELSFAEGFYDEHGWPSDGLRSVGCTQMDYYASSFAIPFYSMVYAKLIEDQEPQRASLYRRRAADMARDVEALFST